MQRGWGSAPPSFRVNSFLRLWVDDDSAGIGTGLEVVARSGSITIGPGRDRGACSAVHRRCRSAVHLRVDGHGDVGERRVAEADSLTTVGVVAAGRLVIDRDGLVGLTVVAIGHYLVDRVVADARRAELQPAEARHTVSVRGDRRAALGQLAAGDDEVDSRVRMVTRSVGSMLARLGDLDRARLTCVMEGACHRLTGRKVDGRWVAVVVVTGR